MKGGFAQYKLKLSRELKSSVATCPTRRDFIARLKEVAKESTERYDYVYAAIHGEPSFGNKSTFVCVFKDEIVPQKKLRTDTMAAMLGASGHKDFVSCYQSAGKRETIRHWRWPKLDYMPGKKLDYQVHSIGRIQL